MQLEFYGVIVVLCKKWGYFNGDWGNEEWGDAVWYDREVYIVQEQ